MIFKPNNIWLAHLILTLIDFFNEADQNKFVINIFYLLNQKIIEINKIKVASKQKSEVYFRNFVIGESFFKKGFLGDANPDGRIEGHGAHSLQQVYQKFAYILNTSHRILRMLVDYAKYPKLHERSPYNQVGPEKKKKERNWDGTCQPGRKL